MKTKKRTNANQPKETRGIRALFGLSQPGEGRATRSHATYRAVKGVASGSAHAVSKGSANSATTSATNSAAASASSPAKKVGILASAMAVLLAGALAFSGSPVSYAAEAVGTGGAVYDGVNTNTFSAKLDVAEIYIDKNKIRTTTVSPVIDSGTNLSTSSNFVMYDASKIVGGQTNAVSGEFHFDYPNAAYSYDDPDKTNPYTVRITYSLKSITASGPSGTNLSGQIRLANGSGANSGSNIAGGAENADSDHCPYAYQVEMDMTISVIGASGEIIIPVSGINQWQNQNYSSWSALERMGSNKEYTRECATMADDRVYYPNSNLTDKAADGSGNFTFYGGRTGANGSSGADGNYNSGFVTMGENKVITIKEVGAINSSGATQGQNIFISLGDLQHRIESWSGDHGTIKVVKSTTDTSDTRWMDAEGASHGHYAYTIADLSTPTYKMVADKGYQADEITVDGTTITVPDNVKPGLTWSLPSNDGSSMVVYEGNGVFSYTFPANKQDSKINVTWKKQVTDLVVQKFWNDNNNEQGLRNDGNMPKLHLEDNQGNDYTYYGEKDVKNQDGISEIYKWTDLPVYEYDGASGDALDPIKYTITEVPDPAINGYVQAVYYNVDKGTVEQTFDLTEPISYPQKSNGIKEPERTMCVVNTPYEDVEITKTWDDDNNVFGTRPSAADMVGAFTLYNDGAAVSSVESSVTPQVTDNNDGTYTVKWEKVPKYANTYSADGQSTAITYYAKETTVPAKYAITEGASGVEAKASGSSGLGNITNKMQVETFTVYKQWNDDGDITQRPSLNDVGADFTMYQKKANAADADANWSIATELNSPQYRTVIIDDSDHHKYVITYTGIPSYDSDGDKLVYKVAETTVPDKTQGQVNYQRDTKNPERVADGGTITNTKLVDVEVTKNWDDADVLAEQQAAIDDGKTLGSTYERKDVEITLSAKADGSAFDLTPDDDSTTTLKKTISKSATGAGLTVKFENLPAYDANGNEVEYTATENELKGWTTTGSGAAITTRTYSGTIWTGWETTITNTPVIEDEYNSVSFEILKQDKNTGTALSGAEFTVYTSPNDATKTASQGSGDDAQVSAAVVTTNNSGLASITFKQPGTYYVKETKAPTGYEASTAVFTVEVDTDLKSITLHEDDASHTPQHWWERIYDLLFGSGSSTSSTDWVWDGSESAKRLTVKDEPIKANILVRKTWDDNNNQDNLRTNAANATVTLEKSTDDGATWGAVSAAPARTIPATDGSVIVNDEDHYTWENLPAYENGKLVLYRVKETGTLITGDALTGYAYTAKTASDSKEEFPIATVSGTTATPMSRTVNVQNTHTPRTIQIKVTKTWSDDSADKRSTADVKLYKTVNGVETPVDTQTGAVPTTDGDAVTFTGLPAYENGQAITYRAEESDVSGYKTSYATTYTDASGTSQDNATGSVDATDIQRTYDGSGTTKVETTSATVAITNTELTDVEVEKTWIDGANANVTFELWRTAKPEADLTTSAFKNETIALDDGAEVTVQTWKPDTADGWEKVAEHDFSASEFAASSEGSTQTYTFKDLDKKDANGNKYLYRVLETTDGSFTKDQKGNLTVTNTNTNPSSGLAYVNVVKELQGRNWNNDDEFWFWLAPIKGVDSSGNPIEFTLPERSPTRSSASSNPLLNNAYNIRDIPMPGDSILTPDSRGTLFVDAKAKAAVDTTQVGAIGHVVSFSPIAFTEQDVGTWYYLISESLDEAGDEWPEPNKSYDGITYALNDDETKCKESVLKVVVSNDNGKITTELYWDGSDQQSAVPVFTNTYEATAEISPYVVKKVDGRDYKSGDSFQIDMVNLAGSPMRETKAAEGITEPSTKTAATITNSDGSSVYVSASGSSYQDSGATSGDTKAAQSSVHTWIKTSDLTLPAEGKASGVFVYELSENPASEAADDDLIFDTNKLYMKVAVTDNEDGTLSTTTTYWLDAACTKAAPAAQVLVYKKGDNKGELAPAGADSSSEDYEYANAAYFENTKTADVTVKKQWVIKDGETEKAIEPIDNATVQLYRYKVESLDSLDSLPTNIDVWEPVSTHTFDRGDFYTATIKGETYTQTQAAAAVSRGDLLPEDVSGANWTYDSTTLPTYVFEDLPLYTTTETGAQLQYVYRALEVSGSEAYDVTYSTDGSVWTKNWTETGNLRDGELTIKNTVTATNTANIAAVKQLLGRDWKDSDDFSFTLVPTGKATYGDDGEINGTDSSTETIAKIPVPKTDEDKDSSTSGQVATTHAKTDKSKYPAVDPNGGLERLARFGAITYTIEDLVYDKTDGHMQGDFFYEMKETIPVGAQAYDKTSGEKVDGVTYSDSTSDADRKAYAWKQNGITYDGDVHTVHVKVRENKTSELVVQVAYDETKKGDISTGTQFTPVYTNKYDAEGEATVNIDKYIMGRDWKSGDKFDFVMIAMSGAPFNDADKNEFPEDDTHSDDDRSTELDGGKAIHNKEGEHVKRMKYDASAPKQTIAMPKIKFSYSDLNLITATDGELKYPDENHQPKGEDVPAGTAYGQFMYALEETSDFGATSDDLKLDKDTEYARITVIDKGDGTLDYYVEFFEDRYASDDAKRYQPGEDGEPTDDPATAAVFVNQLKRDINVTKAWADPATSDVVLKLQWSTVGGTSDADWNDAAGTSWLADFAATKTIEQDAEGDELTVTWKDLPAYANIKSASDQTGDDIDLNDVWIYYRVVEEAINNVDTRYSETAYASGDKKDDSSKYRTTPYTTEAEGEDLKKDFYVTNFPKDLESETTFGVVKQFIGKVWEDESFEFEIEPYQSQIGKETQPKPAADRSMPEFKVNDDTTSKTAKADADTDTTTVSVNEHAANFSPLIIKLSDLGINDAGVATGTFWYKIKEVIPNGATKTNEVCGQDVDGIDLYYYVAVDNKGNLIKYTGEEHIVKVTATNNGQGTIDTDVSFDNRNVGEFVPVYTNYAMMPTPIEGTKTWVGGDNTTHVNGTVTLEDNEIKSASDSLSLVLQRTSAKDNSKTDVTTDEAGRTLKIVWVKETRSTTEGVTTITREAQQGGDGSGPYTYTVKALDGNKYVDPILPLSDKDGYTYTYSIKENSVPTGYKATVNGMDVTNTCDKKDILKVTKTWDDDDAAGTFDAEGLRPEDSKVTMHLYKVVEDEDNGEIVYSLVQVEEDAKELSTTGSPSAVGGEAQWNNLPLYDENGKEIRYVVLEESVAGYKTTYKAPGKSTYAEIGDNPASNQNLWIVLDGEAGAQTIDVKNELAPATTKVTVQKVWDDGSNVDAKRPNTGVTFTLYERVWDPTLNGGKGAYGSERAATKADGETEIAKLKLDGVKDADQAAEVKETDPDTADALNKWNGEFGGLAATKNGKTVIYYVKEDPNPVNSDYETAVITGNQLDGFTATNKHVPETTNATITKVWADNNNALNTRPATATFALYKSTDGGTTKEVAKDSDGNAITLTISADDQGTDANTWTKTLENLPAYELVQTSEEGVTPVVKESKKVTYYWQETVPAGYTAFGTAVVDPATATNADNAVAAGSTIKVADDPENANDSVITNTIVPGAVQVVKIWDDSGDKDGKRAAAITAYLNSLTLFANDTRVTDTTAGVTKTVATDSSAGTTTVTWTGLPVYSNGTLVNYSVTEGAIPEYTMSVAIAPASVNAATDQATPAKITLTNQHIAGSTTHTVTKTWEDTSNKDGLRPTTADYKSWLKLYRTTQAAIDAGENPEDVTSSYLTNLVVVDNGNNTFTATWNNLPAVDNNGNTYIYSSAEVLPANSYYQATTGEGDSAATEAAGQPEAKEIAIQNNAITNKQMLQDVVVRKVWNDKIADLGTGEDIVKATRPTSITVKLTGDDGDAAADPAVAATEKTATLNAESTYTEGSYADDYFTYTFTQVPIYKSDGATKITYTVSEDAVAGYKTSYVDVPATSNVEKDIIVNTYKVTKLEGTKQWIDGNKPHNNASEVVLTVNWKRNGDGSPAATDTGTVANPTIVWGTTEATKNNFSVVGLPVADADGNTFTYWVSEAEVAGYTTTYTGENKTHSTDGTVDGIIDGGKIVNALKTGDVTITKKFVDSDGSTIPVDALPADYKIAVTYKTIENNELVAKELELQAKADTADPARYTYAYTDGVHTWTIGGVASGTQVTAEEYNYTNLKGYSYKATTTTVTADVWETHSDTNPTYAALIMPQKAANTAPTITLMSSSSGGGEPTATEAKIAYVNTYTRDYGNLEPQKVWNDDLDRDGKRPDSLTFTLYATDGGSTTDTFNVFDGEGGAKTDHIALSLTKTKNDADGAKASWYYYDDLDDTFIPVPTHTEDGKLITYRLVEDVDALPEGYTANPANGVVADTAAKNATKEMKITNTYEPKLDSLSATKVWDDADDSRGLRPDDSKVTLHLYKVVTEGEEGSQTTKLVQVEVEAKVVDSTNATATWTNLPVYQNGTKIKYVVLEEAVAGYAATYQVPGGAYVAPGDEPATNTALQVELDGDTTAVVQNVNIKNTLGEATSTVVVTKVWDDGDNVDGKRPDAGATFKLYKRVWNKQTQAYGAETQVTTRPAVQADVTAAAAEDPAREIEPGSTITLPNNGALTLDGAADTENLSAYELTPADSNTWKGQWINLPLQENGETVIYYVKEDPNPVNSDYETAVITGNQLDGFTATNKHVPETTNATITKVWADGNNVLDVRPDTLTVELWRTYKDGSNQDVYEKVAKDAANKDIKTLISADDATDANTWTYEVGNLPQNVKVTIPASGDDPARDVTRAYTYYWKETVPDGYTATASGSDPAAGESVAANVQKAASGQTLTNTLVRGTVTVEKTFDDANDRDGKRAAAITAYLNSLALFAGDTKVSDGGTTGITRTNGSITADGKLTVTWTGVPIYSDGTKITYHVEEGAIPDYTLKTGPTPATDSIADADTPLGFTLTNEHVAGTTAYTVTKTWVDSNDEAADDHIRPTTLTYKGQLKLYRKIATDADWTDVTSTYLANLTVTESAANTYTAQWANLPAVDANEVPYLYRASETLPANSYYAATTGTGEDAVTEAAGQATAKEVVIDTTTKAISNTQMLQDISIQKIWVDKVNDAASHQPIQVGKRPATITVKLTDGDGAVLKDADGNDLKKTVNVSQDYANDTVQEIEFTKVPIYDADGAVISYTLDEDDVPNYNKKVVEVGGIKTLINTYEVTSITGTKVWVDGKRAHDNVNELKLGTTLNLEYTTTPDDDDSWTQVTGLGHLDWTNVVDGNSQFTIKALPKYDTATGAEYAYRVKEGQLILTADGSSYKATYANFGAYAGKTDALYSGGRIVNTISGTTTIAGNKKWVGGEAAEHSNSNLTLVLHRQSAKSGAAEESGDDIKTASDDQQTASATWSAATGDASYTFSDLPAYDAEGYAYTYWVTEGTAEGYATTYTNTSTQPNALDKAYTGGTITNTSTATDSLKVTKVWSDKGYNNTENAEGLRPTEVAVHLYKTEGDSQVSAGVDQKTLNEAGEWSATWSGLPVYDAAGSKIEYVVVEEAVAGYTTTVNPTGGKVKLDGDTTAEVQEVTVTNTLTPATTQVNVEKVWDDNENIDGKRPTNGVEIKLYERVWDATSKAYGAEQEAKYGDGTTAVPALTLDGTVDEDQTANVKETQAWKGTFANLASTKNGKTVIYYVKETPIDAAAGYKTAVVQGNQLDGFTVTNSRELDERVDKPVRVTWVNDVDALDETSGSTGGVTPERPEQVTVTLQKKNADGKWENVTVKADGTAIPSSITLDASKNLDGDPNNWGDVTTWTGLPKKDAAGNDIEYRVVQTGYKLPGQTAVSGGTADADDATVAEGSTKPVDLAGYKTTPIAIDISGSLTTIVNLFETTTITGTKVWADGNQEHNNSSELADAFTVYRTDKASPQESDWTKLTKDTDYHIDWSGTDDATFNIRGLAKYVDANADQKVEYRYKVIETAPAHYTASYTDASGDDADYLTSGGTVTNTAETVKVYAKKVWAGDANDKSKRAAITFQLTQANGDTTANVGDPKPATATTATFEPITDADNADCVVWENLPKYVGSTDTEYVYDVVETSVPEGYTSSKAGMGKSADDPIVITNTLGVDNINVPVMVKWNDGNNQDAIRPTSADVKLQQYVDTDGDGTPDTWQDVPDKTLTLNDSNNWKGSFDGLPKTDAAGAPIQYKVVEVTTDTLTGNDEAKHYAIDEAGDPANPAAGFTITNTHTPEGALSISASKVWDDGNGGSASLHTDVVLHLYGKDDGLVVYDAGTKKIAADVTGADATVTWTNLPKYHFSDTELVWEVVEDAVPGYVSKVTGSADGGFTVTNKYEGPATTVTASKRWEDANNVDGKRPTSITFELWKKVDGQDSKVDSQPAPVAADGSATYTWTNLPTTEEKKTGTERKTRTEFIDVTKYQNISNADDVIDESAYEALADKSKADYTQDPADATRYINNADSSDVISADAYNALTDTGKSSYAEITVQEEKKIDETVDTTEEVAVIYYVKEAYSGTTLETNGYKEPVIESTGAGQFRAINTRDRETRAVAITKIWVDNNNAAGNRPDHINITLTGDDGSTYSAIVTGGATAESWTYTFEGLPKYKAGGVEIAYTVDEDLVDGYGKLVNGFTITNTNNGTKTLRVEKAWVDNEGNPLDVAPASATFKLVKTVEGYGPQVVDGQDKTIDAGTEANADGVNVVEWTGLSAMQDGKSVEYSVEEQPIEGYSTSVGTGETVDNVTTIKVTNTQNPAPEPDPVPQKLVTYIDPLNDEGQMVVKSTSYDDTDADGHASAKDDKPTDPSHSGYTFMGWYIGGTDEAGNYIIVAKYNVNSPEPTRVVSYINGQDSSVLKSLPASDPAAQTPPPESDVVAPEGMSFAGWQQYVDSAGNIIYVAQWASDCANNASPTPGTTPVPPRATVVPTSTTAKGTPVKGTPQTSDEAPYIPAAAMLVASAAAMVLSRRQMRAVPVRASHAGKHARGAMRDAFDGRR